MEFLLLMFAVLSLLTILIMVLTVDTKQEPIKHKEKPYEICDGCGVLYKKGKLQPVIDKYVFATDLIKLYCKDCAKPYDEREQVFVFNYTDPKNNDHIDYVYYKNKVKVDEKGTPIGYKKIK